MKFMRINETTLILRNSNSASIERINKKSLKAYNAIKSLIRIVDTDIKGKSVRFPDDPLKNYFSALDDIKNSFNGRKLVASYRLLNIIENTDRIDEYLLEKIKKIEAEKRGKEISEGLLKKLINKIDI